MSGHRPEPDLRTLVCRCGVLCEPSRFGWRHYRPRCLAWMRNVREKCARYAGHRDHHRSTDALAYDRERSLRRYHSAIAA